jgi:hypothetical protein
MGTRVTVVELLSHWAVIEAADSQAAKALFGRHRLFSRPMLQLAAL